MTLAEAIRKGAGHRPQAIQAYFGVVMNGLGKAQIGSCTLGAVWEAMDLPILSTVLIDTLARSFPELSNGKIYMCPECFIPAGGLPDTIIHLNDSEIWSREDIADWVEYQSHLAIYDMDVAEVSYLHLGSDVFDLESFRIWSFDQGIPLMDQTQNIFTCSE
jgi:hypothetical protein